MMEECNKLEKYDKMTFRPPVQKRKRKKRLIKRSVKQIEFVYENATRSA